MPGKENISSSRSSDLGMWLWGNWEVKALRRMEFLRSYMRHFLRSLFAWCADLPAVVKGSGSNEQGQGSAIFIAVTRCSGRGRMGPSRGLGIRSSMEILGAEGGGVNEGSLRGRGCLQFKKGYGRFSWFGFCGVVRGSCGLLFGFWGVVRWGVGVKGRARAEKLGVGGLGVKGWACADKVGGERGRVRGACLLKSISELGGRGLEVHGRGEVVGIWGVDGGGLGMGVRVVKSVEGQASH